MPDVRNDGLWLDFTDFDKKFDEWVTASNEGAERGVGLAAMQLLNDAVLESPTVPLDEGTLRRSGSAFAAGRYVGKIDIPGLKAPGTPNVTGDDTLGSGTFGAFGHIIVGTAGFNTPYAAHWHETPANFQEPSAGTKYLETPLKQNARIYLEIVAEAIREDNGG